MALAAPLRRVVAPSERNKTVIASACRSIVVNRLTATLIRVGGELCGVSAIKKRCTGALESLIILQRQNGLQIPLLQSYHSKKTRESRCKQNCLKIPSIREYQGKTTC